MIPVLLIAAATALTPLSPALDSLVHRLPVDSLAVPLARLESTSAAPRARAQAALLLGHLYYARGEYRRAADAYARAAARFDPGHKDEARYWGGLSWLALGDPVQARAALEPVAANGPRRAEAMLAMALAWEQSGRSDKALETLERLLEGDPGEAGPAALERLAALERANGRPEAAERARNRLLRDDPGSIEAALAATPPEGAPTGGPAAVEVGSFGSARRARTLATAARGAGFSSARVIERPDGSRAVYVVVIGVYAHPDEARDAGARAARALGVSYRLTAAP